MGFKDIAVTILILVAAMWIFSCLFNPMTRWQTNEYVSDAGSKISSGLADAKDNVLGAVTPSKVYAEDECFEMAKNSIPEHINLYAFENGVKLDWWQDGSSGSFVRGKSEGQNINYYYEEMGGPSFSYSEQAISPDGNVMGTNSFEAQFVVKPIPDTAVNVILKAPAHYLPEGYGYWPRKRMQEFEIIDVKILTCNLLKKSAFLSLAEKEVETGCSENICKDACEKSSLKYLEALPDMLSKPDWMDDGCFCICEQ